MASCDGNGSHPLFPELDSQRASGAQDTCDRANVVFDVDDEDVGGEDATAAPVHRQRIAAVIDRVRLGIARFGRLAGMRLPGASYSALNMGPTGRRSPSGSTSRHVVGGGIRQDGVFSNLSAKPESANARRDPNDLGDDDDLVRMPLAVMCALTHTFVQTDAAQPPTYEAAAADTAPSYWESSVFGGNPMVTTEDAWSPNGMAVGDLPDMLVDGMVLGTVFAFLWNLFICVTFQFVGFVLTFILHSTHAAKFGSRAGLGITLIQYALLLFSRIPSGAGPGAAPDPSAPASAAAPTPTSDYAAPTPSTTKQSAPGEIHRAKVACYVMMGLGALFLVHSIVCYMRMCRMGMRLIAAARGNASQQGEPALDAVAVQTPGSGPVQSDPPAGFLGDWTTTDPVTVMNQMAGRWRDAVLADMRVLQPRSAEDYVIRPGPQVHFVPDGWPHGAAEILADSRRDPLWDLDDEERGHGDR
ncbi:hypothetical protein MSPP1_002626 [Malassezia sp. CBS 17886]|nr:hypothetical protein MSPP1_002626 [Malassezia sp. CBS 17886]